MIFEMVCPNCNTIIRDGIPLVAKGKGMDIMCPNCDNILIAFYHEDHPMSKMMMKKGTEQEQEDNDDISK